MFSSESKSIDLSSSHRTKPGAGESVTNLSKPSFSCLSLWATCLIKKLPNEMPERPSWQFEIE